MALAIFLGHRMALAPQDQLVLQAQRVLLA
jgi:hypothetical protein